MYFRKLQAKLGVKEHSHQRVSHAALELIQSQEERIKLLEEELKEKIVEPCTHVDNFIDYGSILDKQLKDEPHLDYARWVLNHFRLSAILRYACDPFMVDYALFATYKAERFRVVGASRLGDVWITNKFDSEDYQLRVSITELYDWNSQP